MAITQDEFVVKVRADTNGYSKEMKKLRKALENTFDPNKNGTKKNTRDTLREYRDLSRRIADQMDFSKVFDKSATESEKSMNRMIDSSKKGLEDVQKWLDSFSKKTKKAKPQLPKDFYDEQVKATEEFQKRVESARKKTETPLADRKKELDIKKKESGLTEKEAEEYRNIQNWMAQGWENMPASGAMRELYQDMMPLVDAYNKYREAIMGADPKSKSDRAYLEERKAEFEALKEEMIQGFDDGQMKDFNKDFAKMADQYNTQIEKENELIDAREKEKKEAEQTSNADKKKSNFFERTWATIKHIAKNFFIFRQVRAFFNSLNSLWSEGTQNAYEYSRATGGIFAQLLDKKNSMKTAFGNSLGALNATLTQIFTPFVTQFYEVLVNVINKLSEVLAKLFQLSEYLQARTDIMARWSDNIKATKQLIQGFDELNIFQGNGNTLPKDMFYTVKNEDKYSGFWEAFGEILTTIKTFFTPFWQKALKVGIDLFGKIKDWWNGVEDTDEDEQGREITRVVEPGVKHAVKEWFGSMANSFKTWFLGDETRGTEGFWQKQLKPWLIEVVTGFETWLGGEIGKIISAIQDYFGHKGDEVAVGLGLADSVEEAEAVRHNKLPGVGGFIDPNGPKGKDMTPWLLALLTGGIPFPLWMNAKGGVYTKPAFGIVGEASSLSNPELITPTSLLDNRLQANNANLISAFAQMTGQVIQAIGNVDMNVSIGDEVIARSAARGNSAYYKMTGRALIR